MWLVHANLFKEKKEFTRVSLIANLNVVPRSTMNTNGETEN